jgi:hypothetical protein
VSSGSFAIARIPTAAAVSSTAQTQGAGSVAACANGSGDKMPIVISTSAKYHPPCANQVNGLRGRAELADVVDALSTKGAPEEDQQFCGDPGPRGPQPPDRVPSVPSDRRGERAPLPR